MQYSDCHSRQREASRSQAKDPKCGYLSTGSECSPKETVVCWPVTEKHRRTTTCAILLLRNNSKCFKRITSRKVTLLHVTYPIFPSHNLASCRSAHNNERALGCSEKTGRSEKRKHNSSNTSNWRLNVFAHHSGGHQNTSAKCAACFCHEVHTPNHGGCLGQPLLEHCRLWRAKDGGARLRRPLSHSCRHSSLQENHCKRPARSALSRE